MKSTSRNKAPQKGFTLIELLVVIAIIAILASILFPVFARARENARRASCQSNLKQIGLGIMQYTQDYDEMTPFNVGPGLRTQPYTKSYQIWRCPSDSNTNIPDETNPGNTSYAINMVGYRDLGVSYVHGPPFSHYYSTTLQMVGVAAIEAPATTIMVADNNSDNSYQVVTDYADVSSSWVKINSSAIPRTMPGVTQGTWSERHLDTINTLFCDGHVKAVKLDYYTQLGTGSESGKATHLTIAASPD
jgi:prepilin-type N-terminal cleavage/methylation domain-containing protein/prepilin-type processing-associated H-X9-DG protein